MVKTIKMMQSLAKAINKSKSIVIVERFKSNDNNWEEVDNSTEFAKIENNRYFMENRDVWSWKYYDIDASINKYENFIIEARLRIEKIREIGQLGIVWGFDKNHEILNRFTIAADLNRYSIMQFEKNHRRIYHRFSEKLSPFILKNENELSITKEHKYLFFKINKEIIYVCHEAHFYQRGPRIGFYIEPGVGISSSFLTVKTFKK